MNDRIDVIRFGGGPLEAARRLAGVPGRVLVERSPSVGPGAGSVSWLAADPLAAIVSWRGRPGQLVARDGRILDEGDPLDVLARVLAAGPGATAEGSVERPGEPFSGGLMGVLGYELGERWEKLPAGPPDDLGAPDCWLGIYDEVAIIREGEPTRVARRELGDELLRLLGVEGPREARLGDWLEGRTAPPRGGGVPGWQDSRVARGQIAGGQIPASQIPASQVPASQVPASQVPASEIPGWPGIESSLRAERYRREVADLVAAIHAGDLFQANLTQRLTLPVRADDQELYAALRARLRPSHGAWLDLPTPILSASPEGFLRVRRVGGELGAGGELRVISEPIKGTRPRGASPDEDRALASELQASAKDRAENLMIVDLMRNDLSRVARPGSVWVPELHALQSLPAVHHLVSRVEATLRPDAGPAELLRATFPPGSVTGAPKVQAMVEIRNREPVPRGAYCGSIGWIGWDGALDLSVAIRTAQRVGDRILVGAGGGVVADSDPAGELRESLWKAHALAEVLLGRELPKPDEDAAAGRREERGS